MYITKKRIKGHTYYYAVIGKRVDGKPRIVWQKYLGKIEDIVARADASAVAPCEAEIFEFGASAALWQIAKRLDVVKIIDRHATKRRQGGTVGEYMLIAALNRALSPGPKTQVGEWFEKTVLRRFMPHLSSTDLKSQRFWDHMDRLDRPHIQAVERDLTEHLISEFNLDLRAVVYDTTNFITYLDTSNPSKLAQRGHSKEKRGDLRIVGLALLTTLDFHIPLFHDVYPGNVHDSTEFRSVTDELVERYRILSNSCEHVTLIWDKGNNSPHNQDAIDESPYHCVGSVKLNQVPDLLKIPLGQFECLTGRYAGHQVYRTRHELWGKKYTVLVVYNDALYLGQMQGEATKLKKATQALRDLSQRLDQRRQGKITKGKAPDLAGVGNKVEQILGKSSFLSQVIRYEIALRDGVPDVRFFTDHDAFHHISSERFGKTVLFTTNDAWSNEDIITAYRGQFEIEHAFSQMKDPQCVAWRPMFHWTDSKIRVHAFYCVLALTLTSLLRREILQRAAAINLELEDTSATSIINRLENIKEVLHVYPTDSKMEPHITLSRMTPQQKSLFDLLGLETLSHS